MIMKAEWFSERSITPKDRIRYTISREVIQFTESILFQYGEEQNAEGLVYWAGIRNSSEVIVTTCIAPNLISSRYGLTIDHLSNYYVVEALSEHQVIHIGQVHSHPFKWVGHSETDNERAAFKVEGLLSLVVPHFCKKGMQPLTRCGVHRFASGQFVRLSTRYIKDRMQIVSNGNSILIDQRKA